MSAPFRARVALLVTLAVTILTLPPDVTLATPAEDVAYAEDLVRKHWMEGLPFQSARELTPVGVARLVQMLSDPAELEWLGNVVAALGMSGAPQAFRPLADFAAREPRGEIDRAEYRGRVALPFALGHLARTDPRALRLLEDILERAAPQAWRFKHLSGVGLQRQMHEACITGLALAGHVEKILALQAQLQPEPDPVQAQRRARHLGEAMGLAERVARDGPERAFERSGQGLERP